jgi:hypothetical protein
MEQYNEQQQPITIHFSGQLRVFKHTVTTFIIYKIVLDEIFPEIPNKYIDMISKAR